ncbi:hypothetical protein CBG55_01285 [Prevotella intermedia]|uniref:Uncharacterized protein n=1 Tax=Prevotella intermedia TaxID=28131 RepID=A0A2M8TLI6_PREIN|nr:hypothetical protein CBG55_01285 [Prevotella intermedia]PJI24796.1 hypothetical protein CTM59_01290 [Prevotella intermedia]
MLNHLTINALQNLLFCVPKAAVLHGKSVGFATQKSRFRNVKAQLSLFNRIIFTRLNRKALTISVRVLLRNTCKVCLLNLLSCAELTLIIGGSH